MSAVIEVENISKRFFFGERNRTTFLEEMTERAKAVMAALSNRERVLFNSSKRDFGLSKTFRSTFIRGKSCQAALPKNLADNQPLRHRPHSGACQSELNRKSFGKFQGFVSLHRSSAAADERCRLSR
jgi:hypothetical protein